MRKESENVVFYETTKKDLRDFIATLQRELLPISEMWSDKQEKQFTNIIWDDPKRYNEGEMFFYGTEAGMYLTVGRASIWFPKTSSSYEKFLATMREMLEDACEGFKSSIPNEVWISYDGEETIELRLNKSVKGEEERISVKAIAEELIKMLYDYDGCQSIEYYECDDDGNIGPAEYRSNYYVGVKVRYNMWYVN